MSKVIQKYRIKARVTKQYGNKKKLVKLVKQIKIIIVT